MGARSVVVVMPFGGADETERRRAILNFKRLEYLVRNKCNVKSASLDGTPREGDHVVYAVEVAKTAMDNISILALQQIEAADILIALISEPNSNVLYELGYRRARNPTVTVVLVVDSKEIVPIYESSVAHQIWKQVDVMEWIDKIAKEKLPKLSDFAAGIDPALKDAIDMYDSDLARGLENALQEIEDKFVLPETSAVRHLRGIVSAECISFYPCSIVEISFAKRNEFASSEPARVVDFDENFSRLYGYAGKTAAENDDPLTLKKLLGKIQEFCDQSDWDEFMADQVRLTNTVIKGGGFARASVPLRFNKNHPHREYQGTSFLPCVIAQVFDGDLEGRHRMYLLVVYIEIRDTLGLGKPVS